MIIIPVSLLIQSKKLCVSNQIYEVFLKTEEGSMHFHS